MEGGLDTFLGVVSMNSYKVSALKPGMSFSKPAYIDDDTLFMPSGVPVREKDLNRLEEWGVEEILSEGALAEAGDEPVEDKRHIWGIPNDKELNVYYEKALSQLDTIFERIDLMEKIESEEIDLISDGLISKIESKKVETTRLVISQSIKNTGMSKRALNTAILAVSVGLAMKRPRPKLIQLVNGALLYDVGMMRVPEEIRNKKGSLEKEEMDEIKKHPLYSYKIIAREQGLDETIARIALEHHERWDGEGYPQGTKGGEHSLPESRIVAIASAFEAMISERSYRAAFTGYEAMKSIISDNSRKFDPEILRYFIKSMGIYPLGSIVMLNDSTVARVINGHSEAPLRPEVATLIDQGGREYFGTLGPVLDLLERKDLFIVKVVDLNSLLKGNDSP